MKKLLFIIILLSFYSFAQENMIVRQQELSDSLDAVRTLIGTGGVPLPSNVMYKDSIQTITGQKNFSGTVKFRSDTSITMGGLVGSYPLGLDYYLKTANSYQIPLRFNVLDANTPAWTITSGEVDFTPSVTGKDHVFNIGHNWSSTHSRPQFGQQMEANYEQNDTTTWYEWFSYFNDYPSPSITYNVRPFQLATVRYGTSEPYRYTSSISTNADVVSILDERNISLIEFRTQTYGATSNETTIARGRLQDAFGNSMIYIMDSLWIFHNINNMPWLFQAKLDGSAKELMRIDNNERLLLSPSTDIPIVFSSPVYGNIYWTNEAGTGTVPIYKENGTDRIYVGGQDGMVTNKIEVINMPQDTSGLESGQFYVDDLTGSVQYTFPEDIVTNGTFTTWTGTGKSATPTGWTFAPDPRDTTAIYIEQNPTGKLHYVWDGSSRDTYVLQDTSTIGVTYGYSFVVEAITDTALVYIVGNGVRITSAGIYSGSFESVANEKIKISPEYGAGEITLDNFKLWVVGGNIDAPTYDVPVILDSLGVLISGVGSTSTGNPDSLGGQPASAYLLKSDSTIYLTPSDANSAYATKSHTHTEFYDTLAISFGIMDTVTTGDYVGRKIENNITITEIAAYTNTGTVTFNIEERGETTPNTAGTDVMTSDLVADDNQQETTTFSNSGIARDSWLVLNVTSKTGDPTIFGVTIRYVKVN